MTTLINWLTPARRRGIYTALGALASVAAVLGLSDQVTLNAWVQVIDNALAVAALALASVKARSVSWTAVYTVGGALVAALTAAGLLSSEQQAYTLDVLAAAVAAAPLIVAALRTDPSTSTGEPAAEATAIDLEA